jgi:hypothetical protein
MLIWLVDILACYFGTLTSLFAFGLDANFFVSAELPSYRQIWLCNLTFILLVIRVSAIMYRLKNML